VNLQTKSAKIFKKSAKNLLTRVLPVEKNRLSVVGLKKRCIFATA
jgi:hypothetical protein